MVFGNFTCAEKPHVVRCLGSVIFFLSILVAHRSWFYFFTKLFENSSVENGLSSWEYEGRHLMLSQ